MAPCCVLKEANCPFTYLLRNLWVLALVEALGSLVPVGAHTLTSQLNLVLILLNDLAETEIRDLNLTVVEDDIL